MNRKTAQTTTFLSISLLTAVVIFCAREGTAGVSRGVPGHPQTVSGNIGLGSFPRDRAWPSNTLHVCWEDYAAANALERGWVQDTVQEQFARASVHLVGWGQCASANASQIHIRVRDEQPNVTAMGRDLAQGHMVLNFTYHAWDPQCAVSDLQRQICIRTTAVHEFGHAIGLAHEHNRADRPASCNDQPQGDNGDYIVGGWDQNSIMNYCNQAAWSLTPHLSDGDIMGIRFLSEQMLPFERQVPTALHETDRNWVFRVGDYNLDRIADLYAIARRGREGRTEIHVLNGATNFDRFLLHQSTALHATDDNWDFSLVNLTGNERPELVAINRSSGQSRMTELHVLSGDSNYRSFSQHIQTGLHATDANYSFGWGDWDNDRRVDLFVAKKINTGSGRTEVHVFGGRDAYRTAILHTSTVLHETGSDFDIQFTDWNHDGRLDMVALSTRGASHSTELHVIDGHAFNHFIYQRATLLHQTDIGQFEFAIAPFSGQDSVLFAFKKYHTGAHRTEVHVLTRR